MSTQIKCTITVTTVLTVDSPYVPGTEEFRGQVEHVINDYTTVPKDSPSFPSRTVTYPVQIQDVSYELGEIVEPA